MLLLQSKHHIWTYIFACHIQEVHYNINHMICPECSCSNTMADARALEDRPADNISSCGYDCEFVDKPPTRSQCPICLLVPRDPHQTPCCGNAFCKDCITKIKLHKKPCPTCKTEDFLSHPDKGLERELYSSQVCCSFKSRGCDWRGELRQLDRHLNSNSSRDNLLAGCSFLRICCDYCQHTMCRRQLQEHRNKECLKRPFTCPTCKEYESDYEDVISTHMPECKCRPVECPNKCGLVVEAQNLQAHLSSDCELAEVECEFKHAGCEVRIIRKLLPGHMTDNMVQHMSLLAQHASKENRKYKEHLVSLEKENRRLTQRLVDLESKHQDLVFRSSRIPTFHINYTCRPKEKIIHIVENPWLSEPFYASLMGPSIQLCVWWEDSQVLGFKFVNRGPSQCCLKISTTITKHRKELLKKIVYYGEKKDSELTTVKVNSAEESLVHSFFQGHKILTFSIDHIEESHK